MAKSTKYVAREADASRVQITAAILGVDVHLVERRRAAEAEVRIAISGNLCRCTGYQNIVAAALDAAKRLQGRRSP